MKKDITINGVKYRQVNEVMGLGDSVIAEKYKEIESEWFFLRSKLNEFVKEGLVRKSDLNEVDDSLETVEKIIRHLEKLGEI